MGLFIEARLWQGERDQADTGSRPAPGRRRAPRPSASVLRNAHPADLHGNMDNHVVRADARQGLRVGVGVVPGQETVIEPEYALCSQQRGHGLLDLAFVQLRVAVG